MTTTLGTLPQTGTVHAAKNVRTNGTATWAEARCNTRNARVLLGNVREGTTTEITCRRCQARVAKHGA